MRSIGLIAVVACALLGANGLRAGVCDPLVPENCLLPFPNNFYTRQDPSTPTGLRVVIPDEASPLDRRGNGFSFEAWSRLDGFSISSAIFSFFPNVSISNSNVPGWQDISRSLDLDCPTIILDSVTGQRLEHFAELDYTTEETDQRAFMMWPIQQLIESRRYIVAIRGLRNVDNLPVSASPAFAALRDGAPSSDPDVENRRDLFEDIFTSLDRAGVRRSELILAWDFTVASEKMTTGGMLFMRDDATSRIPTGGPSYKIVEVTDEYSDRIFRRIEGEMQIPHYLTRNALPGSELVLDSTGMPVYQGVADVPFTVAIPRQCTAAGSKCPILVYGHGLTGTRDQVLSGTQQKFAEEYGYVLCGVDLWGMSSSDVPSMIYTLTTDFGRVNIIPDRSHQGMLNQIMVMKLLAGDFSNDPLLQFGGASIVDTTQKYYWGISQGGILGAMFLAVSNDVTKGHLGVPGAPYPLLLARSVDFDPYFTILKTRYDSAIDRILLLSFLGLLWDRAEPSGYLNLIAQNPEKRAVIDYANGDAQVTYLGAYFMTRSIGGKMFKNNVHCGNETTPIYGIEEIQTTGPVTQGSVAIGFEYEGIGCGPVENIPPSKDTDTHGRPRNDERNLANMDSFFRKGEVYDFCDGKGCYIPA